MLLLAVAMILFATATFFIGLSAFMFRELANAPEAYQDETGFNLVWCNNDTQIRDVSCVWIPAAA